MAFIRVHPCSSTRMGALQSSRMPSRAWLRYARAKKPAKSRSLKASWAVFIVLGIPLGLMAILGPLAYAGYYIEPLKQFWRPWPPDYVKGILAVSGFAITLGILLYSHGREAGYQHGKTAGKAVARKASAAPSSNPHPPWPRSKPLRSSSIRPFLRRCDPQRTHIARAVGGDSADVAPRLIRRSYS